MHMVAEEFHGSKRYMVHICTVFCKYYGTKWYMVEMVRFSENCMVLKVRYMVAHDHGIPMVSLTVVKTAVNNRGKFTV